MFGFRRNKIIDELHAKIKHLENINNNLSRDMTYLKSVMDSLKTCVEEKTRIEVHDMYERYIKTLEEKVQSSMDEVHKVRKEQKHERARLMDNLARNSNG